MNISELQNHLLDILDIIDNICKNNNIIYFLDGGTEIGAVREKDIIPWDDDLDIKIKAKDYIRFCDSMRRELPEHLHIIEPQAFSPYFYDFIVRVFDDRWTIRKEREEDKYYNNYTNRVSIDVKFISNMPNGLFRQKLMILKTKILYGMGMRYRFQIEMDNKSFIEKMQIKVLHFLGRKYDAKTICSKWYKLITKYNDVNSQFVYPCSYSMYNLKRMKAVWFSDIKYGQMRGKQYPIPCGYDEELTFIYGEYMKPPENRGDYITHLDEEDLWHDK